MSAPSCLLQSLKKGHSCFKDSDEGKIRARRKKFWEKAVDIDELYGPGMRGQMQDDFNHSN
uniref:Uncharacterized protein n=1 Tax=Solanum lycopersicum TaxID=4081 RepID=A0A3Q7H8M8_SOLLC